MITLKFRLKIERERERERENEGYTRRWIGTVNDRQQKERERKIR